MLFRGNFASFLLFLNQPQVFARWGTRQQNPPGNPKPERNCNMEQEAINYKCRYIIEAFPDLSPDVVDLLYKIVLYAQSGLE
jgi:hypothetical protein